MLRALMIFICVGHGVHAEEAATETVERDQFGCAVQERPDELTFSMFRDAWRSVAADKLYSLRRHEAVVVAQNCDCAVLRPAWATITDEFEALGFGSAPQSSYRDWSQTSYFPVIAQLRREVGDLCKEAC
jgi:hypothetical protein